MQFEKNLIQEDYETCGEALKTALEQMQALASKAVADGRAKTVAKGWTLVMKENPQLYRQYQERTDMTTETKAKHTPAFRTIDQSKETPKRGLPWVEISTGMACYEGDVRVYGLTLEDAKQKARLLAAAPDLLEAAVSVMEFSTTVGRFLSRPSWWNDDASWELWVEASEKVQAAIAKAKG